MPLLTRLAALPALAAAALLLPAWSVPAPAAAPAAQDGGGEQLEDLEEVRADMLAKALELAELADDIRADVERDQIYRAVLELDPDDRDARKALGYSKRRGEWVFRRYREPETRADAEELADLEKKRTAAAEGFAERLDACFPQKDRTPRMKHELRQQIRIAAMLDWHNEDLRERAGQRWDEQRQEWRIEEVVVAKLDRALRRGLMKDLDANAPAGSKTEIDPGGAATNLPFGVVLGTPRLVVASTGDEENARRMLQVIHMTPDFLNHVFGIPDPFDQQGTRFRYYSLADPEQRLQFYSNHPEYNGEPEKAANIGSSGFGQACVCVAAAQPDSRLDMATNQRVGQYLQAVFGADLDKGWVRAGLGLYLSYQLCDTRLSLWIQETEYGESDGPTLGERLKDPSVDWLDEARLLLRRRGSEEVDLNLVLGKQAAAFTAEDLLASYAVAAFLFEGHRAELIEILKRIGKGETPVVVFETELEMPMDAFRERLVEWLAEMRKG